MDTNIILQRAKKYISEERDVSFKKEVEVLIEKNDEKELNDRFYQSLEFGTGGLRGIIGGGTNRINSLVVQKATQGLAQYIIKTFPEKAKSGNLKAVIAYDSRHYSDLFAEAAALIFIANGFTCYLFSALRPTPELSYAIRELGCDTGLVITASHNPPAYNGYKAYWNDAAQVIPPHDKGIIDEVNNVTTIKMIDKEEALKKGMLILIDKEIDEKYWAVVKSKLKRPELIKEMSKSVKVVYTPLHGTGALHVETVLGSMGFTIITVPEQKEPNGDFPTVEYPNPEEASALKMAIDLAIKENADIVMATDPDADRFACAVKDSNGEMQLITGNEMGALFTDYICLTHKEFASMPKNPVLVRSIVTSHLSDSIAASYGVETVECLTGFKWIAADIEKAIVRNPHSYIFGFEESYGYNFGDELRDKDGVTASALCAEMTLYWRSKGKSLIERLHELFIQHGAYCNTTVNKVFPGAEGNALMKNMMKKLREENLLTLGGKKIIKIRDVQKGIEFDPTNPSASTPLSLPESNVLQYFLEDATIISVRPSGTEPKIKYYIIHPEMCGSNSLSETLKKGYDFVATLKTELNTLL